MSETADAPTAVEPPAETVAGYTVHRAASLFPLMDGEEFNELVESVRQHGVRQPVVIHDGVLIDGRNRLRAVERLKDDGHVVEVPTVELSSLAHSANSVVDWIYSTNKIRRHMTTDALAMVAGRMLPLLEAEAAERQKATHFQKGKSGNPSGKKQVTKKTSSPARRDRRKSDARTTAGRVASKAGVSLHKGKQVVEIVKGVENGTVSADDEKAVREGRKKLRDVTPKQKGSKQKTKPDAPLTLEEEVARAWEKFKSQKWIAAADMPAIRQILMRLIKAEEKAYA